MTAQLDDEVVKGLAKLAAREVPLRVLKSKYRLPALELELLNVTEKIEQRRKLFRMRLLPEQFQPERRRLKEIQDAIEAAKKDYLEGFLTQMTVGDEQEVDAHYLFARNLLAARPPELTTAAARKAWDDSVDFTANHTVLAKKLECVIKCKLRSGDYERLLTPSQARALDPRLMVDIWKVYTGAFELTESELGKSAAPTPAG